jgi:hypothetical protein
MNARIDMAAHNEKGETADDTIQCTECGAFGYGDDNFCACCGSTLQRCCHGCGAGIRQAVAIYCSHCGTRLGEGI